MRMRIRHALGSIRSKRRLASLLLVTAIGICLLAPKVSAQEQGSIVGTITDSSGAIVPGAKITVTQEETGISRELTSNAVGGFVAPALRIGTYTVAVEFSGFQGYEQTGIILNVRDIIRVDIQMTIGAATETITVTADVARLQTETGEVSELISGQQVTDLAINGRSFVNLAILGTGVVSRMPTFNRPIALGGTNTQINFNGTRNTANIYLINGQENYDRGCGGCPTFLPSMDAIQEFSVQSSNASSDQGFGSGGQIEVAIKSGTSDFHGTVYWFGRRDSLDANNFFRNRDGQGKPPLRFDDYGYTIGGPIVKNKTFFFWSQEWRRIRAGSTITQPAIPVAMRTGDFSGSSTVILDHTQPVVLPDGSDGFVPFVNNTVPVALQDPNGLILGQADLLFPLPNAAGNNFSAAPSLPADDRQEILRVDHNFSDKMSLMFHYLRDDVPQVFPTSLWDGREYPTIGTQVEDNPYSAAIRLTYTISPTLLNEAQFSFQRRPITGVPTGNFEKPSGLTIQEVFPDNKLNRIPDINLTNGFNVDVGAGRWPWENVYNFWVARDQITKSHGNHTFSFGFAYMRYLKQQEFFGQTQGRFIFNGSGTSGSYLDSAGVIQTTDGLDFADLLVGRAREYQELRVQANPTYIWNSYGLWFGDTWKMTPKLTLDYGLRWEGLPRVFEENDQLAAFFPDLYDPAQVPGQNADGTIIDTDGDGVPDTGNLLNGIALAGQNGEDRGLAQTHWGLFQPRFGFAYRLNEKTVIRGGYGLFFERVQGNDVYNVGPNPPFSGTANLFDILDLDPVSGGAVISPSSIQSYDRTYDQPYTQQFSFGVQRELNPQTIFNVKYVGSTGTHLSINRGLNQPTSPVGSTNVNLARPFLGFGTINQYENSTSSNYHSLQAGLRATNWKGLTLQGSYTWSHSIDYKSSDLAGGIQDAYNLAAERGNSDFDVRHVFTVSYIYSLPFYQSAQGVAKHVMGGWQVSGVTRFTTGYPFTVGVGGDPAQIGGGSFRANLVGDPNNGPRTAEQWFNTSAFASVPTVGTPGATTGFGNAGRNVVRGQGINNWDISLFKNFPVTEIVRIQFRSEFFNTFNHTTFSGFRTSQTSSGFGEANTARESRTIEFGLKIIF